MDDLFIWIVLLFIAWIAESIGSARRRQRRRQGDPGRSPIPPSSRPGPDGPESAEPSDVTRARDRREPPIRRRPVPEPAPPRPEPATARAPVPPRASPPEPSPPPAPEPVVFPPELIIVREPTEEPARPAPVRVPEPPPPPPEAVRVALETLEPLGKATHEDFHAEYVDRHRPAPRVSRPVARLGLADVRRGIILAEILGSPKSER